MNKKTYKPYIVFVDSLLNKINVGDDVAFVDDKTKSNKNANKAYNEIGHSYSKMSYSCKMGKHYCCTAKNCKCSCNHLI